MDGLRRSHYDVDKATINYPRGGLFTSREDIDRTYRKALMQLQVWQANKRAGKSDLPPTLQEFERYLDITLAEQSFSDAQSLINLRFSDRSNSELVKEMREAIAELRRLGCNDKASSCEYTMRQRIGEE